MTFYNHLIDTFCEIISPRRFEKMLRAAAAPDWPEFPDGTGKSRFAPAPPRYSRPVWTYMAHICPRFGPNRARICRTRQSRPHTGPGVRIPGRMPRASVLRAYVPVFPSHVTSEFPNTSEFPTELPAHTRCLRPACCGSNMAHVCRIRQSRPQILALA